MSVQLTVENADDLRDALPTSGVFEMTDCMVYIDCPVFDNKISEIERMIRIIEGTINVVDIAVGSFATNISSEYVIDITEVSSDVAMGKKKFKK